MCPALHIMHSANLPAGKQRFHEMIDQLKQELHYWESYLSSSRYVAGDDFALADVSTGMAAGLGTSICSVHMTLYSCAVVCSDICIRLPAGD
jgi:glutathione S-transferase